MKKVLLINEGFSDNIGDQVIKESLCSYFKDSNIEVSFKHLSKPKLSEKPDYNYHNFNQNNNELSLLKNLRIRFHGNLMIRFFLFVKNYLNYFKWFYNNSFFIKKFLQSNKFDYVVIGGGQLINSSNRNSPNTFSMHNFTWTKYIPQSTKLFYVGIGLAKSFNKTERYFYKKALSKAQYILVRDSFSKQSLKNNFKIDSSVIPDVAFYSSSIGSKQESNLALVGIYSFHEYSVKFTKTKISREQFYEVWVEKVNEFIEKGFDVKLFYTTQSDAYETILFKKYLLEKRNIIIQIHDTSNVSLLNDALKKSSVVYSARMHALLLGFKQDCVVHSFDISEKLKSFVEEYVNANKNPLELKSIIESSLQKII